MPRLSSTIFGCYYLCLWCCIVYFATEVLSDPSLPIPTEEIDVDLFLDSHSAYNHYTVNKKQNNVTSLVYITPWNKHGYEIAVTFGKKFDLISPVWFQITNKKKRYSITGIQDIDSAWLEKVRVANPDSKIVPRFIFAEWQAGDFHNLMTSNSDKSMVISNILRVLQQYKFNGAVIEIWSQFVGPSEQELINFIQELSSALKEANLCFVLVIPPPFYRNNILGRFNHNHFERLSQYVDYFSLMTYDYSPPAQPGPNSPIDWAKECVFCLVPQSSVDVDKKRSQLLTGLNFYGMHHVAERHAGEAILGHQFVEFVKGTRANFIWDAKTAEHHIRFRDAQNFEHVVYYPTLMSLARRLALAEELGVGVSIWEIGQGLDSFYSIF